MRYINQIEVEEEKVRFDDYFNIKVATPTTLRPISNFIFGFEVPADRDLMRVEVVSANTPETDDFSIFLNLNYTAAESDGMSFDTISERLDTAHQQLENVFESLIKDV